MDATAPGEHTRAGLYQRVSRLATAADREKARSVEQQNDGNRQACGEHGWQAAQVYEDPGLSASIYAKGRKGGANRPEYRRMLADVTAGRLDVLVLWEPSRGSRELENWAGLLNACRRTGTRIHVTSHGHTYDMANARDWRALADDGVDSAAESDKIRLRLKRGKDAAAAKGIPQGGAAYGIVRVYRPGTGNSRWDHDEVTPEAAPVIREVIGRVAAGESYVAIARSLNGRGIPSPAGRKWSPRAVTRLAGNPVYASAASGVSQAESLAARSRLADARRKGERPSRVKFRYSYCLRCAECGQLARGTTRRRQDYYMCSCGTLVSAPAADKFLDDLAVERLSRPDAVAAWERSDDAAVLAAEAEMMRLNKLVSDATKSYAAGRIPIEALESVTAEVTPKVRTAERKVRELRTPSALRGLAAPDSAVVRERWNALTPGARKAAIRVLMPALELRKPSRRGMPSDANLDERIVPWP
jgi:site-specific DNA recombinase